MHRRREALDSWLDRSEQVLDDSTAWLEERKEKPTGPVETETSPVPDGDS